MFVQVDKIRGREANVVSVKRLCVTQHGLHAGLVVPCNYSRWMFADKLSKR